LGIASRKRGEYVEAHDPEWVDHAVCTTREHEIGRAVADDLGSFADRLAAGCAGREATVVGPAQIEVHGDMPGGAVELLFQLPARPIAFETPSAEVPVIQAALVRSGAITQHPDEGMKVLNALAGAQVDPEPVAI